MKKFLVLFALALGLNGAMANELDNEVVNQKRLAAELPKTVVVRVDQKTGAVAVMHSKDTIAAGTKITDESKFIAMNGPRSSMRGELDQDSSTDSWYFYWNWSFGWGRPYYPNYYYYPTYYYGGYNYNYYSYYNYGWNNCNYYYYRWY